MLQQTQVSRVIPKYNAFIQTFPTIQSLATASLSDVLRLWVGLGYNRRAKYLHQLAQVVVRDYNGIIPTDVQSLLTLPGVGEYTASAIRIFAYNQPDVCIETNIRTVIIYHFYPRTHAVDDTQLVPILSALASLIPGSHVRRHATEWYWALMDYGAYIKTIQPNPSRRSKQHTKQSAFIGSIRQVRGEIVRAYTNKIDLAVVQGRFPKLYQQALDALVREGLLTL
jgi:A/G-specific adenine glycosylase